MGSNGYNMKFFHEIEDCIIGIIVGVIIVGISGYYFSVPEWDTLWGFIFGVSALFTIFDVVNTLKELSGHAFALFILFLNNLVDIILEIVLAGKYLGFEIPYLSNLINPFLEEPSYVLIIGLFFIISSIFWVIASPIIWREPKKTKLFKPKKHEKKV